MFGVLDPRCWTGSSMLDCHVLKGFGIYMIGILGSLSDVVLHVVHSSCNILVNITRVLSQPSFLFLPLTKLPHPNTIYRMAWCRQLGIGV